jgi:Ala-tRNA(Pro) deacylase
MTDAVQPGPMPGLVGWLEKEGIDYEIHEHERSLTALATARAEGVDPHTFAKVVWVRSAAGRDAFMVVDAVDHLDLEKAAAALEGGHVRLVAEEEIARAAPGCEVGAMPAIGRLFDLPTYADHAIARATEISFNAGSHRIAIRVDRAAWERAVGVTYHDLAARTWREPAWYRS